jgi:hypothetical protein
VKAVTDIARMATKIMRELKNRQDEKIMDENDEEIVRTDEEVKKDEEEEMMRTRILNKESKEMTFRKKK